MRDFSVSLNKLLNKQSIWDAITCMWCLCNVTMHNVDYLFSSLFMLVTKKTSQFCIIGSFAGGIHWWPLDTPQKWVVHDDVIKWKYFPRYWPFVRGIHRSPVNSPHKGQWRGALMFSLICIWINGWVNNRGAGGLRRYRAHYDIIVMNAERFHVMTPPCILEILYWYVAWLDHGPIYWPNKHHYNANKLRGTQCDGAEIVSLIRFTRGHHVL